MGSRRNRVPSESQAGAPVARAGSEPQVGARGRNPRGAERAGQGRAGVRGGRGRCWERMAVSWATKNNNGYRPAQNFDGRRYLGSFVLFWGLNITSASKPL